MPTPLPDEMSDDDFELAFIEIIDARLATLRTELDKLSRFRARLVERQEQREASDEHLA